MFCKRPQWYLENDMVFYRENYLHMTRQLKYLTSSRRVEKALVDKAMLIDALRSADKLNDY
jgi:hypothetical protein